MPLGQERARKEANARMGLGCQGYIAQGRDPKSNLVLNRFRYMIPAAGKLYSNEKTQGLSLPDDP